MKKSQIKSIAVSFYVIFSGVLLPAISVAQEPGARVVSAVTAESSLILNVEPVSLPYISYAIRTRDDNFLKSFANPGMSQSLALSTSFYSAGHFGLKKLFKADKKQSLLKAAAYYLAAGTADYYLSYFLWQMAGFMKNITGA